MTLIRRMSSSVAAAAAYLALATSALAQVEPPSPPRQMVPAAVELDCALLPDRTVRDCRILSEEPPGAGADILTLTAEPRYHVPEPVANTARNGRVRLSIPVMYIPAVPEH